VFETELGKLELFEFTLDPDDVEPPTLYIVDLSCDMSIVSKRNLKDTTWADEILSRREALLLWNTVTSKLVLEGNAPSNATCADLLLMAMRGRILAARGYEWEKRGGAGTIQTFSNDNNDNAAPSCLLLEIQFTEVIGTLRRNLLSMGSSSLLEQVESTHKIEVKKDEDAHRAIQNEVMRKQSEGRERLLETKRKDKVLKEERAKMDPDASVKEEEEAIASLLQVNNEFRNGMLSLLEEVGKSNKMLDEAANVAESNLQKSERLNNELGKELSEPFCGLIVKIVFLAALTFASCYMIIKMFPKPPPSNGLSNRRVWSLSEAVHSVYRKNREVASTNGSLEMSTLNETDTYVVNRSDRFEYDVLDVISNSTDYDTTETLVDEAPPSSAESGDEHSDTIAGESYDSHDDTVEIAAETNGESESHHEEETQSHVETGETNGESESHHEEETQPHVEIAAESNGESATSESHDTSIIHEESEALETPSSDPQSFYNDGEL